MRTADVAATIDNVTERRSRRVALALVVSACALALAVSAAGAPPRATSVRLAAPVLHLAADATGVAVQTHPADRSCNTILLWQPPARPAKVAVQGCSHPSTGAAVTSLALHGRRPAWVAYAGGNYREFTVSTTTNEGKPVFISFRSVPVENSASVRWRVAPGSGVLAFEQNGTLWRVVAAGGGACPYPYRQGLNACVRVPGSGTLLGVGGGRLLVHTGSGVALLRQNGSTLATYADAPEAVTDGTRVVELVNGRVVSGGRSIAVSKTAHLAGTTHGLVAVTARGKTLVIRLRDGRTRSFPGVVAALSDYGLYTATGPRLTFTPLGALGL